MHNDQSAIDLNLLYANAKCLKDEVYRQWMGNLAVHARDVTDPEKQDEALRRIDYIDRELLNREWRHANQESDSRM